jgi:antirestriction protein ArdC
MKKMNAEEYNGMRQSEIVTKIVELMAQGKQPWRKPWKGQAYQNPLTGAEYKGRNPAYLSVDVAYRGYSTPLFMGAQQAKTWGWHPAKGSKATFIKQGMGRPDDKAKDTDESKPAFRGYTKWVPVFNLDVLVEGKEAKRSLEEVKAQFNITPAQEFERLAVAEAFVASQQVSTHFIGDQARYSSSTDKISMPPHEVFIDPESFYSTWIHEHGHSTGHSSRLDRDLGNQFGSKAYAYEELIAELCSTLTCERLAIACDVVNHASYLQSWMSALADDQTLFFKALAQAQQASDYLFTQWQSKANSVEIEKEVAIAAQ